MTHPASAWRTGSWAPAVDAWPPAPNPRERLPEERQHALRRAVRLSEHARAGLLQDLQLGEVDHLLGHVHVADTGLRGGQVLLVDRRVLERVPEAVLHSAERRALRRHDVDRRVDLGDVGHASGCERVVAYADAAS